MVKEVTVERLIAVITFSNDQVVAIDRSMSYLQAVLLAKNKATLACVLSMAFS